MKLIYLAVLTLLLPGVAIAQQTQQQSDPKTEATERMLLDEMTAHRNWYATAIAKDNALQQSQKALTDAQSQISALQKQIDAANEKAASSKALAPPDPK